MNSAEARRKTIFLNGVEVESIALTGNSAQDLAVARRFLAEQAIDEPQARLTLRAPEALTHGERVLGPPDLPVPQ